MSKVPCVPNCMFAKYPIMYVCFATILRKCKNIQIIPVRINQINQWERHWHQSFDCFFHLCRIKLSVSLVNHKLPLSHQTRIPDPPSLVGLPVPLRNSVDPRSPAIGPIRDSIHKHCIKVRARANAWRLYCKMLLKEDSICGAPSGVRSWGQEGGRRLILRYSKVRELVDVFSWGFGSTEIPSAPSLKTTADLDEDSSVMYYHLRS